MISFDFCCFLLWPEEEWCAQSWNMER